MDNSLAYMYIFGIGTLLTFMTIILALKTKKRIIKYYPAIIGSVLSFVFCIVMTFMHSGNYIAILYMIVLICVSPGVLLSLVVAALFDFVKYTKGKKVSN